MDGSINAHAPNVAQRYGVRYQQALGQDRSSNSETLFQELLSIPVVSTTDPQDGATDAIAEVDGLPTLRANSDEDDRPDEQVEEIAEDDERELASQSLNSVELAQQIVQQQSTPIVEDQTNGVDTENNSSDRVQPLVSVEGTDSFQQQDAAALPNNHQQIAPQAQVQDSAPATVDVPTTDPNQGAESPVVAEIQPESVKTPISTEPVATTEIDHAAETPTTVESTQGPLNEEAEERQADSPLFVTADSQLESADSAAAPTSELKAVESQVEAITEEKNYRSEEAESRSDRREKWYEHRSDFNQGDQHRDDLYTRDSAADQRVSLDFSLEPHSGGEFSRTSSELVPEVETLATTLVDNANFASSATEAIQFSINPSAALPSRVEQNINRTNSEGLRPVEAPSGQIGTTTSGAKPSASGEQELLANEAPAKPVELSQQERIRLVQRVARSFTRLGADGGQISLRLHPPELGALSVSVRIEGRSMSARMQTESAAARDVILESLPQLRQRLSEQGFDVQQIQVELAGSPTDSTSTSNFNSSQGQRSSDQQSQPNNPYQVDYRRLSMGTDQIAPRTPPSGPPASRTLSRTLDLQV